MEIKDKSKYDYDEDAIIDYSLNDNFELDDFIDRLAWTNSNDIEKINKLQKEYFSFSPKEEEYIKKNAVRNGVGSVWEVYEEDFSQEARKQLEAKINTFLDRFSALKEQKKSEVSDTLKEDDKIIYRHYYDEHNQKSQEELKSMLSDSAYFAYVEHNGVRTIFNIADNGDLGITLNIPYLNLEGELHTNVKTIYCQENNLSKIVAPDAKRVYCNNNKIKEIIAPNASYIDCRRNLLEKIELESAIEIRCNNNPSLKELNAPKCEEVYCENTLLTESNMQVAKDCFIDGINQSTKIIRMRQALYEKALEQVKEKQAEKLNELWDKFRYKDNEYPEANDSLQFSATENLGSEILLLLNEHSSNPETIELLEKASIEANALKENVDFIHYTPDIMDFDMFIEGDGTVVYDETAYQKAVEEAEKFKEEFYKRQDKVEAVKEQYPQEMKILEEFFNAPEDWVRERKKFFSELAQNKELLAEITNTNNVQSELLEQGSGRIFRKGSDSNEQAVTEQKRNVLEVTPKHIMDELLIVEDELDTLICNEQYLTELYAPNTENIVCKSNGTLLIIDAPNATTIECRDCEMLEKINAPNCVKLICEGSDFLKKEDIEVAYNCEIEGLKEQRGIKK